MQTDKTILTKLELDYLQAIYKKRITIWRVAFLGTLGIATYTNILVAPSIALRYSSEQAAIKMLSLLFGGMFNYAVVSLFFYFLFRRKILPLKRDIKNESGLFIFLLISRKNEFREVNKFFLFFDSVEITSKEVTEEEYYRYTIGEQYQLVMSEHSQIVMDEFGHFDLI